MRVSSDMKEQATKPAIGQVWRSLDPRDNGRLILITNIEKRSRSYYAVCRRPAGGWMRKIRFDRFKPTRNGYEYLGMHGKDCF